MSSSRKGMPYVWVGIFFWVVGIGGCGYTLSHRLKDTFHDKRGIFVPVFDNYTEEIGAERVFTNALIRELQSRGEIVISSRAQGALELRGEIARINVEATALTEKGFDGLADFRRIPSETGIKVEVGLRLIDPKDGRQLWASSFSGFRRVLAPVDRTRDYQAASATGPITQSIIETKFNDIARDIVRDVYDEMIELF